MKLKIESTWVFVMGAWKAVVAAAAPILYDLIDNIGDEVIVSGKALALAVLSSLTVYFVPNKNGAEGSRA